MSAEQIISSPMDEANNDNDVQENDYDLEVDVIDDTPEEDRGRVAPGSNSNNDHEDELKNVSQNVQKRIKKLKYDFHEERRAKEASSRLRDEAVAYAQKIHKENESLESL